MSALRSENDHGLILVGSRLIQVEFIEDGSGSESNDSGNEGTDSEGGSGGSSGGECSVDSGGGSPGGNSTTNDTTDTSSTTDNGQGATGSCESDAPDDKDDDNGHKNGESNTDKQGANTRNKSDEGGDESAGVSDDTDSEAPSANEAEADQDKASALAGTIANGADVNKEHLASSRDIPDINPGLRGAMEYTANAFSRVFGAISTAIGFSKGYDRERKQGGSKSDSVREGFREVALEIDDSIIQGGGLTGGALVGGALGSMTPAGPIGTAVGATTFGLGGAAAAGKLYNESSLDDGFDIGVNYIFDSIESWQHRE